MTDKETLQLKVDQLKKNINELHKKNKIKFNLPDPTPDTKSSVITTMDDILNPKIIDISAYRELKDSDLKLYPDEE